jgi:hypothetical protein
LKFSVFSRSRLHQAASSCKLESSFSADSLELFRKSRIFSSGAAFCELSSR